jgi:hypothetical protein
MLTASYQGSLFYDIMLNIFMRSDKVLYLIEYNVHTSIVHT